MNIIFACLCQWFLTIIAIEYDQLLLNGSEFPSSIYVPLDKSYLLECQSKNTVYWKLYLNNGRMKIVNEKFLHLTEFDHNRDGFYQCCANDNSLKAQSVFIFSNSARSIDRQWTELTKFHENLLTICRPVYFNYGFNEQFIELIDSKQTIRYNRSALLVKHIRSTTHLFCKLFLDTTSVGIRVQTLIKQNLGSPLLSDQALRNNDYLEMKTNERDTYRIAFEDDSVYFHCPATLNRPVQWHFLSFNYYLMKTLPIFYEKDTKIHSVKMIDAGMYTCQTENTIHKRILLTIIHPPKAPDNIYEHTLEVNFDSKYLICCHLDAVPYPTYSWSMSTEVQKNSFVWCSKRCCWLHVVHKTYENIVCTSGNQLGKAKYHIHLIVHDTSVKGTVVYDEPKVHNHNHTNDFNLTQKLKEKPTINPTVILTDAKTHSSTAETKISKTADEKEALLEILSSSLKDPEENFAEEFREHIVEHEINNDRTKTHVDIKQELNKETK